MEMTASRRRILSVALAAGGLLLSATAALAIGIGAAQFNRPATLMSPLDYRAAKVSLDRDSHAAFDKCLLLEGTAFGVCRAEARAEERMKRAKLEVQYLGTVDAEQSAAQVKVEGNYEVAVAKCEGTEAKPRLACLKSARDDANKQLSKTTTL